ncbi:MAG: hypothetical protein HY924_00300 [Elusimicrobia bacterium]|nr:hypothetical protein [Elusimicrobiota bacterium]
MAGPRCARCGAAAPGLVCSYCGALAAGPESGELERRALEEFCGLLQGRDAEGQAKLLESGYLPSSPVALIEAGVRCVPFVQGDRLNRSAEAAARRLEAVTVKLRLLPQTEETRRAVSEFEAMVREFRKAEASDLFWGLTVLGILLVVITVVGLVLLRRFLG